MLYAKGVFVQNWHSSALIQFKCVQRTHSSSDMYKIIISINKNGPTLELNDSLFLNGLGKPRGKHLYLYKWKISAKINHN